MDLLQSARFLQDLTKFFLRRKSVLLDRGLFLRHLLCGLWSRLQSLDSTETNPFLTYCFFGMVDRTHQNGNDSGMVYEIGFIYHITVFLSSQDGHWGNCFWQIFITAHDLPTTCHHWALWLWQAVWCGTRSCIPTLTFDRLTTIHQIAQMIQQPGKVTQTSPNWPKPTQSNTN